MEGRECGQNPGLWNKVCKLTFYGNNRNPYSSFSGYRISKIYLYSAAERLWQYSSVPVLFIEQRRWEVSLCCVREHRHNCLAFAQLLCQLQCCCDVSAAGYTAHQAFKPCQVLCCSDGFFICDYIDLVEDLSVEYRRDQPIAYLYPSH